MPQNRTRCACPNCRHLFSVPSDIVGRQGVCPKCRALLKIKQLGGKTILELAQVDGYAPTTLAKEPMANSQTVSSRMSSAALRRKLTVLQLRQRLRAFCDATGLGPSWGERFCCVLLIAIIPFALSFLVAITIREPAGYAALQGLGSFFMTAIVGAISLGTCSDEELESRRECLVRELPMAEEIDAQKREAQKPLVVTPLYEEDEVQKCPTSRPSLPRRSTGTSTTNAMHANVQVTQVVHVERRKSGGVAALLELFFGFFFCTFGVGHLYAGSIGRGLFLLFGWWMFLAFAVGLCLLLNALLAITVIGLCFVPFVTAIAAIALPTIWFFLLIVSTITAANTAR